MGIVTGILYIVIGLVACFFGKRIYRIVLALVGFAVGYPIGAALLAQQGGALQIIGAVVVGLIVAAIFYALYKFAYLVFGLFLGLALGALVVSAFSIQGALGLVIIIVLGIVGAVIGSRMADLIIRLSTAFGGASAVVSGLGALGTAIGISLPLVDMTSGAATTNSGAGIISIIAVVVLGIVGYLFQTRSDT